MYSSVASAIFSVRNANRTSNGEIGRMPVTVGQIAGVAVESTKYNNLFSRTAKRFLNTCKNVAENDKVFNGITKAVNFAKNNVNPLIVCSSGLNVLLSNDKQSTVIAESGNLAGMFLIEGLMKKHLDKVIDKLPISKKWQPIVKGIVFVIGSISGSTIGQKIGKLFAAKLKKANEEAQKELLVQKNTKHFVQKTINYKA